MPSISHNQTAARRPAASVESAIQALEHAPEWRGVLVFDTGRGEVIAQFPPPFPTCSAPPFAWGDEHDTLTAAWLQRSGIFCGSRVAARAVDIIARRHLFHRVEIEAAAQ